VALGRQYPRELGRRLGGNKLTMTTTSTLAWQLTMATYSARPIGVLDGGASLQHWAAVVLDEAEVRVVEDEDVASRDVVPPEGIKRKAGELEEDGGPDFVGRWCGDGEEPCACAVLQSSCISREGPAPVPL
jgi:hypothetical protein